MFGSFLKPSVPSAAIGFGNGAISVVALGRAGKGQFVVNNAASAPILESVLTPSFDSANIHSPSELRGLVESLVIEAGLGSQKKWSATLPSKSARAAIITLEEAPSSSKELEEVLEWKTESVFGFPSADLRVSRIAINESNGKKRYFSTAIRLSVLEEYETLFDDLGWRVGLTLPRVMGEANWFSATVGDSMLISTQEEGFTAVLLRDSEPFVVRSVSCGPGELDDEIYRLLVYYQDRFSAGSTLDNLLVLGNQIDSRRVSEIAVEAVGERVGISSPEKLGLDLPSGEITFDSIAAPAGLAALAWR